MSEIRVGTAGWSYPSGPDRWVGTFYPSGTRDELAFYASVFDTVEVNSSFYRPLTSTMASSWVRRTPAGFLFSVKLWQKFTHPRMFSERSGEPAVLSTADAAAFKSGLAPLADAGRLACLLAQFPPGFKRGDVGALQRLQDTIHLFAAYPLAVELRHRSWSDDPETERLLRAAGVSWVMIDEPKFSTSIASEVPATSPLAYFRFHGRNAAAWWAGAREGFSGEDRDASPGRRYDYLYSPEELAQLGVKVREREKTASQVLVYFNNHPYGQAPANALQFKRLLGLRASEPPSPLTARFPQLQA